MKQGESLKYVGPHAAVEVECPDGSVKVVKRGGVETFPAEVADVLVASGDYERVKPDRPKAPAPKAEDKGAK